jgi:alpha-1,2-mannosyltransferase
MTQGVYEGASLPSVDRRPFLPPTVFARAFNAVRVLFIAMAALAVLAIARMTAVSGLHSTDFWTFYESGLRALHGLSPYPSLASLPEVADPNSFAPFVYPPLLAFAIIPISVLPFAVANMLFFCLNIGAILLALRLLDVRDPMCYAVAFASVPVLTAPRIGSISAFLLLGVAVAWRYRDRTWPVASAIAAVIVVKLFLWPLWLWLVFTRRYAAAGLAAGLGVVATFGAWAVIGFAGLHDYPQLLARLSELTGVNSYSLYALERAAGLPAPAAQAVMFAIGAAVAWLAVRYARGGQRDARLFMAAIGLALLLTPIMWEHYLVLLLAPIAIARPTLSRLWILLFPFWLDANSWSYGDPVRIAPVLALSALLLVSSMRTAE